MADGPHGHRQDDPGLHGRGEAANARHSVLSFNAVALLNRIRATFDPDSREKSDEVIRTLAEVELLHVEDLRVARPTEWVLEQLYLIVNARYEERRSIVFTSDIDSDADGPLSAENRRSWQSTSARARSRGCSRCAATRGDHGRDDRVDLDVPDVAPALDPCRCPSGRAREQRLASLRRAGAALTLP